MAFTHGKDAYFALGDNGATGGTTTDLSAYVDQLDFPFTADVHETTVFSKDDKTYIVGLKDKTVSVGGVWDPTLDAHMFNILGLGPRTFDIGPAGSAGGSVKYTESVAGTDGLILTNYSGAIPVGDAVRWTAELQGSGVASRTTF